MNARTIPLNVLADLCEQVPGFAEKIVVRKAARPSTARKGLVIPFADILRGNSARDLGDPPPPVLLAPAATTRPTDAQLQRTTAPSNFSNVGTPTTLGRASNSPKQPINSRSASTLTPENFKDMAEHVAEHIDASIQARERAYREQLALESFNSKRSAFNQISPTKKSDKPTGSGSAWSLRNLGGAMAAAALGITKKSEAKPLPSNSAWRPLQGSALKG